MSLRGLIKLAAVLLAFQAAIFVLGARMFVEHAFVGDEYTRLDRQANAVLATSGLYDATSGYMTAGPECLQGTSAAHDFALSPRLAAHTIYAIETYNRGSAWRFAEFAVAEASLLASGSAPDWSYGPFQLRLSTARRALVSRFGAPETLSDRDVLDYLRDDCLHNRIALAVIKEIIQGCGASNPPETLVACVANFYRGAEGSEAASIYSESFRLIYQKLSHELLGGTLPLLTGRVREIGVGFAPGSSRLDPSDYAFVEIEESRGGEMDRMTVQGLHDGVGDPDFRQSLAESRATAVEAVLLGEYPDAVVIKRAPRSPTEGELRGAVGAIVTLYKDVSIETPMESELFRVSVDGAPSMASEPAADDGLTSSAPPPDAAASSTVDSAHDREEEVGATEPEIGEIVVVPERSDPFFQRRNDPAAFCRPSVLETITHRFGTCPLPEAVGGVDADAQFAMGLEAFEDRNYPSAESGFSASVAAAATPRSLRYLGWSRAMQAESEGGGCFADAILLACAIEDPSARARELIYGFDNLGRWTLLAGYEEEAAGLHVLEAYERFFSFEPYALSQVERLREWRRGADALHDAAWLLDAVWCPPRGDVGLEECEHAGALTRWASDDWSDLLAQIEREGELDEPSLVGPASYAVESYSWRYARDPALREAARSEAVQRMVRLIRRATGIWRDRNPRYLRTLAAIECLNGDPESARLALDDLPQEARFEAGRSFVEECLNADGVERRDVSMPVIELTSSSPQSQP